MATYSKVFLSGSINGQPIAVTSTSSLSATPIHTTLPGTSSMDEIYIYATNQSYVTTSVTICWGNTGSVNQIPTTLYTLAGRTLLCDGMLLNNGLTVYSFTSITGSILIDGFVNRIQ